MTKKIKEKIKEILEDLKTASNAIWATLLGGIVGATVAYTLFEEWIVTLKISTVSFILVYISLMLVCTTVGVLTALWVYDYYYDCE